MPAIIPPNPWKYAVDLYRGFVEAYEAGDLETVDRLIEEHFEVIALIELSKLQDGE